jgi:hypothetical protein
MQYLSQISWFCDIFNCNFFDVIEACEGDLYIMYKNLVVSYGHVDGVF